MKKKIGLKENRDTDNRIWFWLQIRCWLFVAFGHKFLEIDNDKNIELSFIFTAFQLVNKLFLKVKYVILLVMKRLIVNII